VVRREGGQYMMLLPTILDLSDRAFLAAHCFFYGGSVTQPTPSGEESWFRLDVRAADRLTSPDIHGSFYFDSATAQLRRMDIELSRVDKLPRSLRAVASVNSTTRFIDIAGGISVIQSVCAVTRLRPGKADRGRPPRERIPVELQQLARYQFDAPPPDVPAEGRFEVPQWRASASLPRRAVWCIDP
jgi:hypothetical protein